MLNHWAGKLRKDVRAHSAGSAQRTRQPACPRGARPRRRGHGRLPQQELGRVHRAGVARDAHRAIGYRMLQLLQLPLESMSHAELRKALTDISSH